MRKDIILFVNAIRPATFAALRTYQQRSGRALTPVVIVDEKIQASITERNGQTPHAGRLAVVSANFDSPASVRQALKPYQDRILAVTSQYENSILELKKLLPYLPYLPTPTESSLEWSTEKKVMRELLEAYDVSLVPRYTEVTTVSNSTIKRVESMMSYPLVVKPSGLEGSLLVSLVNNRQELRNTLRYTFREVQKGYDTWIKRQAPTIVVEEFMKGDMYSIDTYVAIDGTCHHTPPVKVVTGRNMGFDDFFGYMRLTPSGLDKYEMIAAYATAQKACHALGLRSVTAHVELMKTPSGWKVIELGPRVGGYRHDIYNLSYGINHLVNDILNRAGEEPEIPEKLLSHTAVFNIYARQEGVLESIEGLDQIEELSSFISLAQTMQVGDTLRFAKNNGDPVLEVTLSNPNRRKLETDIHMLQQALVLQVKDPIISSRQPLALATSTQ